MACNGLIFTKFGKTKRGRSKRGLSLTPPSVPVQLHLPHWGGSKTNALKFKRPATLRLKLVFFVVVTGQKHTHFLGSWILENREKFDKYTTLSKALLSYLNFLPRCLRWGFKVFKRFDHEMSHARENFFKSSSLFYASLFQFFWEFDKLLRFRIKCRTISSFHNVLTFKPFL